MADDLRNYRRVDERPGANVLGSINVSIRGMTTLPANELGLRLAARLRLKPARVTGV